MGYVVVGLVSAAVAFVSGLLGLGGAVLLIPALLVVTPLVLPETATIHPISGVTSVQVLTTTLVGVTIHGMRGTVSRRLVAVMGPAIAVGAFGGAWLSRRLEATVLLVAFTLLATLAAVLMLRPAREPSPGDGDGLRFSGPGAAFLAVIIGFWGGVVGAPGGFVLIPAMIFALGIPTRVAMGSALGVVLISAVATSAGKLAGGMVPLGMTVAAVAGAVPGSALGSRLSARVPVPWLRRLLGIVMAGVALRLWVQLLR